ncbi:hypothetical protein MRX96_043808 [Rhipicephalus microplus]
MYRSGRPIRQQRDGRCMTPQPSASSRSTKEEKGHSKARAVREEEAPTTTKQEAVSCDVAATSARSLWAYSCVQRRGPRSKGGGKGRSARFNVLGSFIKTCPLGPAAEEPGRARAETCSTRLAGARAANKKRTHFERGIEDAKR